MKQAHILLAFLTVSLKISRTDALPCSRDTRHSFHPRQPAGKFLRMRNLASLQCAYLHDYGKLDSAMGLILSLRAGSTLENESEDDLDEADMNEKTDDEEEKEEEEIDEEDEEEEDHEEYSDDEDEVVDDSDEYDEYDTEEEAGMLDDTDGTDGSKLEVKYDEPYHPSHMLQLGTTLGVIMVCRRFDMYSPKVVRVARVLFVSYLILVQIFLAFVRVRARIDNDRTPVTLSNPITSLVKSQLSPPGGGTSGDMVKDLASQFLSSKSTVLEYDLRQVKSMNGSTLFSMITMWFFHFKFNNTQPLFISTATGMLNLLTSPLFQVYVLGMNLERPFKNPQAEALREKMEADQAKPSAQSANDEDLDERKEPIEKESADFEDEN